MNKVFLILSVILLASCSSEERPSYEIFENTLPSGGMQINYESQSLTNINEISKKLSLENKIIFEKSLEWFGTESDFSFELINGKTAHQLVKITNCLKSKTPKQQKVCFE